jgi:integrase
MPSPVLLGRRFYLRVRVPRDLLNIAPGRIVHLPVDGVWRPVKVGSAAKLSLETSDVATAKTRFGEAYAALVQAWEAMRSIPAALTHKQMLALAGEIRGAIVYAFDDEPGSFRMWAKVLVKNQRATIGRSNPLKISTPETIAMDMERRFGSFIDIKLAQKGLSISPEQRPVLLQYVRQALDDAAVVNMAKADGDYSNSGAPTKYPEFVPVGASSQITAKPKQQTAYALTFTSVIDEEVRRRSAGKDAVPMRGATVNKFRSAADGFCIFRGSDDATMVTAREGDDWKQSMLREGKLSNNSIKQRLQNLRTVLQWARQHSLGELYPTGNPLDIVKAPAFQTVASDARTYTMDEAATVLLAARQQAEPELRWLPWMCAYTGARINELAQLTPRDFFKVGGDWFFRLTTAGGKTLKTKASERVVPIHPALVQEGLIDYIDTFPTQGKQRLFHVWSTQAVQRWVRVKVGLTREELAPSHGWRHLFEDLCMNGGVTDAARSYITGRATGKSSEGYGKSQAMLPGLANEMRKVPAIPLKSKRDA